MGGPDPQTALPVLANRTDRKFSKLTVFIGRQPAGREPVESVFEGPDPQPSAVVETQGPGIGDRAGELLYRAVPRVEPINGPPDHGPERSVRCDRQTPDVVLFQLGGRLKRD